jgi:cytochrome c5
MSTTITMWLGIAFVVLSIIATYLQAWLWGFPMVPDPGGPDPNGKSTAPKHWIQVHRIAGMFYVLIYIVLMAEMIPRLWEYQVELPARTVMHAVFGIMIGLILIAKLGIIRWFQHFGKSLPVLGFWLFACTIILALLSLPHAIRGLAVTGAAATPANVERVQRILGNLDLGEGIETSELTTIQSLSEGRDILASKCTTCHDLRTILAKPKTGKRWHDCVIRMAEKPAFGDPITAEDVPVVTAYLIAITPDIQQSRKKLKAVAANQAKKTASVASALAAPAAAAADTSPEEAAATKALFEEACTECHELDSVEEFATANNPDLAGWLAVIQRMVEEEGAELDGADATRIAQYLSTAYAGK